MIREFLNRREAAAYVRDKGLPCAASTLAKLGCVGGGPVMRKFGRYVVYLPVDLDDWIAARLSGPKTSTSDLGQSEAGAMPDTPRKTVFGKIAMPATGRNAIHG